MGITQSKSGQLSQTDWEKWVKNLIAWLIPLGVLYVGAVITVLQQPFHAFSIEDLIPNSFTWGAMVLYITDRVFDLGRKFAAGN